MEELTCKLDDMADVSNWQEEVAELDKCIAWCDALKLRVEVEEQTAAIEGVLPAKVSEVCRPAPYSISQSAATAKGMRASESQSMRAC